MDASISPPAIASERTPRAILPVGIAHAVSGGLLGLYLVRVMLETSVQPWRGLVVVLTSLVAAGMGAGLGLWLGRRGLRSWPLAMLGLYLLWPQPDVSLALGLGALALVVTLAAHRLRLPPGPWPEALVFLGSLALYTSTLSPGLLPADSGEFQLVSAVLGIAHPPGYALYTMLGQLVIRLLPIGSAAWRLNLLSALIGALTLALVARTVRRGTGSAGAALVAAGVLGVSPTFWAQSTTANIRALTALFTALLIHLALAWRREQSTGRSAGRRLAGRRLAALALLFGLAAGHHSSLVVLGLPLAAYLLWCDPGLLRSPRRLLVPAGALAGSLLVLLYLPIRSHMNPSFDPAPIRTLQDLLSHVLALGFRGDMFYFRSIADLAARTGVWAQIVRLQFGPWILAAMGASAIVLAWRDRRALLLLGGLAVANTVLAITYRAPQTVEYLLPSYVALAVALGYGLGQVPALAGRLVPRRAAPWMGPVLATALGLALAANGRASLPSFAAQSRDDSTHRQAEALLHDAPAGALLLANWHSATPLWYLQHVEGLRPDVEVRYVHPEGATPNEEVWLRRIEEALPERPVIVTNRFYAYEHTDLRVIPFHSAWLVRGAPLAEPPEPYIPRAATFDEGVRLLGYRLEPEEPVAGEVLEVRVYWQVTEPLGRDYTGFAQVLSPAGVIGQGDLPQRSRTYAAGEVRVDVYHIPTLLHATPGEYQLITGFYWPEGEGWQRLAVEGGDHLVLAALRLRPAAATPATLHPLDRVYAGGLRLLGFDVDGSIAGQTRLYLHWQQAPDRALPGPWSAQPGDRRIQVLSEGDVLAEGRLPALPSGSAVTMALDLPGGTDRVTVALSDATGAPLPSLGAWHRPGDVRLSLPNAGARYVPLGGQVVFTGYAEAPENSLRPTFLALHPLTRDYSVSAGLAWAGEECKVDGTPAMGAIPTLKWLRGWRVVDLHRLPDCTYTADLPGADAPDTILTVYDAFTLAPLPVLDERLVREGQGITLRDRLR